MFLYNYNNVAGTKVSGDCREGGLNLRGVPLYRYTIDLLLINT